jgi:hypothetical protein
MDLTLRVRPELGTALRAERARAEPARSSGAGRLFPTVRRAHAYGVRASHQSACA